MSYIQASDFVLKTFLELTSRTYPYGLEDSLVADMKRKNIFPKELEKDQWGNYYLNIGESRTIFASHLDTANKTAGPVNHVIDGNIIKTDGSSILGADDKAGVTILLWMILNKVPGLYYFFIGEEVGCIGSGLAAKSISDFKGKYDRIISFDRRDVFSVITHQSWSRCCSEDFASELAKQLNKSGQGLNYKCDDGGVYTDSAEFIDIIPECTNISVGYYKEHTHNESQDIDHLERLAIGCLNVDWENLPVKRNPAITEYKEYSYGNGRVDYGYSKRNKKNKSKKRKDYGYHDDWYEETYGYVNEEDYSKMQFVTNDKSKEYFDSGSGLRELNFGTSYDWIFRKYMGKLTYNELQVVKEQYLDMDNENDKEFYRYLVEYINDDSL